MPSYIGTVPLETARLHLRRFVLSDEKAVYENWASDPEVARYLTWKAHSTQKVTHDVVESWCHHYTAKTFHWAIVWRETGAVIGSISFVRIEEETASGSIAYALSQEYWGRGVVPEAASAVFRYLFETVGFSEIRGQCDQGNRPSGRVMEKLGMHFVGQNTGTFVDQEGNPRIAAEYRITRQEWNSPVIRKACSHEVWQAGMLYAALADSLRGAKWGPGWRKHVYPRTAIAAEAFARGDLFVAMRAGMMEGTVVLNIIQDPAYRTVNWLYPAGGLEGCAEYGKLMPALVVHTLAVHPMAGGRGVGKRLLAFAEQCAREQGCPAIRLDTHINNLPAIRLYETCGYHQTDRIDLGIGDTFGLYWFYVFEKQMLPSVL